MDKTAWLYTFVVGKNGRDFKAESGILVFDSYNNRKIHILDSDNFYLIKKEAGVVYKNSLWLPEYNPKKAIDSFINHYNKKIIEYDLKIKTWNNQIDYLKNDPKIITNDEKGPIWLYRLNVEKEEFQLYRRGFIVINHPTVPNYRATFLCNEGSFLVSEFEGESYNNKVWFYKGGNRRKARIIILRDLLKRIAKCNNQKAIAKDHVEFLKGIRD